MVRQVLDVDGYWKVVVLYDLNYNLLYNIVEDLCRAGFTHYFIREVMIVMYSGLAKAVTCSNTSMKTSIIMFNRHKSSQDYINSIVHEAEHVKQAMLYAYRVEDRGEPPAYTIGYLVSQMYHVFKNFL